MTKIIDIFRQNTFNLSNTEAVGAVKDLFLELVETHEVLFASKEMADEFREAIKTEL